MKTILTTAIILFSMTMFNQDASAQNKKFEMNLRDSLRQKWNIENKNSTLTIISKDSVLSYNAINMQSFNTNEEHIKYIESIGHWAPLRYQLRYEPAWPKEKIADAKKKNEANDKVVGKLFEELNIGKLNHKFDSYIAMNPDEQKRLDKYEAAKAKAEEERIDVPDFEADGKSWFLPEYGFATHSGIYPDGWAVEFYRMTEVIRKLGGI